MRGEDLGWRPQGDSKATEKRREASRENASEHGKTEGSALGPVVSETTDDAETRRVEPEVRTVVDRVEVALAKALGEASTAGQWAVVAQLARELEARRSVRIPPNVVPLAGRRRP